jgi:hypothetical protein
LNAVLKCAKGVYQGDINGKGGIMCLNRIDLSQVSTRNLSFELGIDLTKYTPLPNDNKKDHKIAFYKTINGAACSCRDVYTLYTKADKAFIFHSQDCYMNEEPVIEEEEKQSSGEEEVKEQPAAAAACDVRTIPEKGELAKTMSSKKMKIILAALGEDAKELFGKNKIVKKYKSAIKEMRARLFPEG